MSVADRYSRPDASVRQRIIENIREDPRLSPGEKETNFRFTKAQDDIHVFTS